MKLPEDIRNMVERRVEEEGVRDLVITGYQESIQLFWLAAIDSRGVIDRSFAESMPPESYKRMRGVLTALSDYRAAHAASVATATEHRTLH